MRPFPILIAVVLTCAFSHAVAQSPAQPNAPSPVTPVRETFTAEELQRAITTARLLIQRQLPSIACDILARTHGTDTQSPDALYLLAHCSRMLGDTETSIAYYQRLAVLLPNAPRPKAELAAIYTAQGRRDE